MTIAFAFIVAAVIEADASYLLGALLSGYGFAWCGHFFVEGNRPATFQYPVWSLIADWRMWILTLFHRPL